MKYSSTITYSGPKVESNLHLILLGGSKFVNTSLNLKYATKNLLDVSRVFSENNLKYKNVNTYKFLDKEFTISNFKKLRSKLSLVGVDDKVIIFISTHGILDKNLNYYLATYDVEPFNPQGNGISYEQVEDLLQVIPARQKLVFLDACHSGEIDSELVDKYGI